MTERKIAQKRDIAERYHVTERCIEKWMADGWLPHIKIGKKITRFDAEAVDAAILNRFGRNQPKGAQ